MASRSAILWLLAALVPAGLPPAAARAQVRPPDPTFASPFLTPPEPYPLGGMPYPNLQPATPRPGTVQPFPGVPPLGSGTEGTDVFLPGGSAVRLPSATKQVISISPRYGTLSDAVFTPIGGGYQQAVYAGGIIVHITYTVLDPAGFPTYQEYEFATDSLVMWAKRDRLPNPAGGFTVDPNGPADQRTQVELFLKGNVVIRTRDSTPTAQGPLRSVTRTLRADEVYYDVENNRAIALDADLELSLDAFTENIHFHGKEIQRLGRREWRAIDAGAHASKLPSDPAVRLLASEASFVESDERPRNIFGIPYRTLTGDPVPNQRTMTARNTRVTVLGVPIFYTPYYRGDVSEPIGPLMGLGFGNDVVFGAQFYTSWDVYKLLALRAPQGHRWRLDADYLGTRGVGLGTNYGYRSESVFGFGGRATGDAMFYGLDDRGDDRIGFRGPEPFRPDYRFRARWWHHQELFAEREPGTLLPTGWTVNNQTQFAWVSDKNFLEQYFYVDYVTGPNQETFTYFDASNGPVFGSLLVQGGEHRDWLSETRWLPRADGAVIGKSFFDRVVYNARAHAAYAESLPATVPPLPELATEQRINTGRFGVRQEVSVPFDLGPLRLDPYGVLDTTAYTKDLTGEGVGRLYGGGGARGSLTFSKTYGDVCSELFNLRGLNHKVTYHADYFAAESNTPYTRLPLLDRLNDDTTDIVRRTSLPFFQDFAVPPRAAAGLQTSPVFDPQRYAIRRLVDNRYDTLDDLQVVRFGVDQRLQTKRGYPGLQHTVDWVSLDLSASVFPDRERDNFGKSAAFFEYNFLWNIGDRTAVQSAGWFDPFDPGVKYYNVGAYFTRPDKTNFYLGYRSTDPLNSKAVITNLYYPLTRKYAVNMFVAYDFGVETALANTITLVRTGRDLTVTLGVTYNAIVQNFGIQFAVVPNIVYGSVYGKAVGTPLFGGR